MLYNVSQKLQSKFATRSKTVIHRVKVYLGKTRAGPSNNYLSLATKVTKHW